MNNKLKKNLSKVMTVALLASVTVGSIPSMAKAEEVEKLLNMPLTVESKEQIINNFKNDLIKSDTIIKDNQNQEEVVRVIVEVNGKSAQEMIPRGLRPTEKESSQVEAAQKPVRDEVATIEGVEVRHSYTNVFNGFSAEVKRKDIKQIEEVNGVRKVTEAQKYTEDMNSAKKLTQIEDVWKKYSLKGEGMVVAILDTGIDYKHKDFKNPEDTGKLKLKKDEVEKVKASGVLKADKNANTYFTEKIPFGYNYADRNEQIVDLRDSKGPHGAHVAGIVGADGDDKLIDTNESVKGVAPEVQLLAMKIFSNGPLGKYTYSDDQLAAIDDSVTLGADVINMSLGSPAGYREDSDPVQDAITRATNSGVMVVVSAGNSSASTDPYGLGMLNDQITVGAPALAKDALMVASYENTTVAEKVIVFKDGKGKVVTEGSFKDHQVDYKDMLNKNYKIVDCGLGKAEECKDVKGNIALIKRGGLTFIEKIINAQNNGAVGVVIYNKDGDESLISMATDPNIKIPAICVGNTTGKNLLNAMKKDTVLFNGDLKNATSENSNSSDFSDFTSWGPSPSLEFKPQVAAPGGQILSTLNEGEHGVMSGTSMAAPHAAGSMALLMEAIKEYAPELKGRELIDYAKNIMMNTSSVKIDKFAKNIPYSPRRQGAGLVQVEDAIRNRVTVTNNGEASVALKEIRGDKATFTLDLKNYGSEDIEYKVEELGGVLTQDENTEYGEMVRDKALNKKDASLEFSSDKIKVPAKGNAKVDVTLKIGSGLSEDRYLEGFIKFTPKNEKVPTLAIPYLGYYGDWGKESITTNNAWDEDKHILVETLKSTGEYPGVLVENLAVTKVNAEDSIMGVVGKNEDKSNKYDSSKIAISPNGDSMNDTIYPGLYLMRNAKTASVEIVDENGKLVRNLGTTENYRKKIISSESGTIPMIADDLAWDGKVFDKSKGSYVNVSDGNYTYKVKLKVDYESAQEQVIEMPVKVDTVGPNVEVVKYENLEDGAIKLYFKANDELSGVNEKGEFPVVINGALNVEATKAAVTYDSKTGLYSKTITGLQANTLNQIEIGAFDYANNLGGVSTVIPVGKIPPASITFDDKVFSQGQITVNQNEYTISGKINRPIKDLIINGEKINLAINNDGTVNFSKSLQLSEGINVVNIKAVDYNGKVLQDHAYKISCDTIKPVIEIESPEVVDNKITATSDVVTLKGRVYDNLWGYKFYVNGELIKVSDYPTPVGPEVNGYDFSVDVKDVKNGDFILLKAVDSNGNETELKLQVVR
ncbi:S8 family serine peptidase [Clostridium senegalense]|uniref:S8 family serine peptidase n=1 Tax=Clostridium senegalense TaxID=1465809 RepID=UPI001C101AE7|nr:S8 family serine peptidase [Clostridium senegalense]MBU5228354.1 S8 family serine peptidase [Clostridium senegalense]